MDFKKLLTENLTTLQGRVNHYRVTGKTDRIPKLNGTVLKLAKVLHIVSEDIKNLVSRSELHDFGAEMMEDVETFSDHPFYDSRREKFEGLLKSRITNEQKSEALATVTESIATTLALLKERWTAINAGDAVIPNENSALKLTESLVNLVRSAYLLEQDCSELIGRDLVRKIGEQIIGDLKTCFSDYAEWPQRANEMADRIEGRKVAA